MKLLFKCDDCRRVWTMKQLNDMGDLDSDFLYPGTIIPTGRCPKCEAGCYPLVLDLASRKMLTVIGELWDALSKILEEEPARISPSARKAGCKAITTLTGTLSPELMAQLTDEAITKGGR